MSNVKAGDRAVTVNAEMDNGLVVDVREEIGVDPDWGLIWLVESLGSPFHFLVNETRHIVGWPDRLLRPLGNPGEHERDEMLRPLPVEDLDIAHA